MDKHTQLTNIKTGFRSLAQLINRSIANDTISRADAQSIVNTLISTCSLGQRLYCDKYGGNDCPDCPVRQVCTNVKGNETKMHYYMAKIAELLRAELKNSAEKELKIKGLSELVVKMGRSKITYNNLDTEITKLSKTRIS